MLLIFNHAYHLGQLLWTKKFNWLLSVDKLIACLTERVISAEVL